jgi:cytochrome c oxidase cbb3-type subunit III
MLFELIKQQKPVLILILLYFSLGLVNAKEINKLTANLAKNNTLQWHELGRKLYNYRCYYCHGYSGDAKTLASTYLSPPPRDFTSLSLEDLSHKSMLNTIKLGKKGTAMVSFSRYLNELEMEAVVDFIRVEFIQNKKINTWYHTVENGWPNHQRYLIAYPFAKGEIALDTPMEKMTPNQLDGYRLFMSTCISCHDRAKVNNEGNIWQARSVSYPRNNFSYTKPDTISAASVYARHDKKIIFDDLSPIEKKGEKLYQKNCAFCHANDGTGKNWIGSFLEQVPRDLTDSGFMKNITQNRLDIIIKEGIINTSMPAWKHVLTQQQINQLIAYINRAFHPITGLSNKDSE